MGDLPINLQFLQPIICVEKCEGKGKGNLANKKSDVGDPG